MARRRPLSGKPLMVASAGAALIIGCGGGGKGNDGGGPIVTGNLMPPPMVEVCVDATPSEATVVLNGEAVEGGCITAYPGMEVAYTVSAEGYVTAQGTITATDAPSMQDVVLDEVKPGEADAEEPAEEPAPE